MTQHNRSLYVEQWMNHCLKGKNHPACTVYTIGFLPAEQAGVSSLMSAQFSDVRMPWNEGSPKKSEKAKVTWSRPPSHVLDIIFATFSEHFLSLHCEGFDNNVLAALRQGNLCFRIFDWFAKGDKTSLQSRPRIGPDLKLPSL